MAVVLFFLRKKIGWYLFAASLLYLSMEFIACIYPTIRTEFLLHDSEFSLAEIVSAINTWWFWFYFSSFGLMFFYVFGLWGVLRRDVRQIFDITRKQMWILISATALLYILNLLLIMLIYQ